MCTHVFCGCVHGHSLKPRWQMWTYSTSQQCMSLTKRKNQSFVARLRLMAYSHFLPNYHTPVSLGTCTLQKLPYGFINLLRQVEKGLPLPHFTSKQAQCPLFLTLFSPSTNLFSLCFGTGTEHSTFWCMDRFGSGPPLTDSRDIKWCHVLVPKIVVLSSDCAAVEEFFHGAFELSSSYTPA